MNCSEFFPAALSCSAISRAAPESGFPSPQPSGSPLMAASSTPSNFQRGDALVISAGIKPALNALRHRADVRHVLFPICNSFLHRHGSELIQNFPAVDGCEILLEFRVADGSPTCSAWRQGHSAAERPLFINGGHKTAHHRWHARRIHSY